MKTLQEKGVVFEYDVRAFAAANIDLTTPISINVKKAPAAEFFHAIFDPLKVAFEIENVTVTLKPK